MAASPMRRAMAAHIYVSEGKDAALVSRLASAGVSTGAVLANQFLDAAYHRAGITLASTDDSIVEAGVAAVCKEAFAELDIRSHSATHPRVGVVDHVSCNPLGGATAAEAGALAARIGGGLASSKLPVYLYGAAREDGRPLAELRRSLGYFGGAKKGEWVGLSDDVAAALCALAPDFGPNDVNPQLGAIVVGGVPWVHNYNLLVTSPDLDQAELMARCRRVARATSARGGGLQAVETMALPHERGVEVACNLLDTSVSSPDAVKAQVAELCNNEGGLVLDSAYFTNKRPDEILEIVTQSEADA